MQHLYNRATGIALISFDEGEEVIAGIKAVLDQHDLRFFRDQFTIRASGAISGVEIGNTAGQPGISPESVFTFNSKSSAGMIAMTETGAHVFMNLSGEQ